MRTTVTNLAKAVGAEERTLRRAVSRGTVRCTRASARRIDVSDAEVSYLRGHWSFLQRARRVLRTEPNVLMAVLFGSLARGQSQDASDIDLLVDLRDDEWGRRQRLISRVEEALGRPVDLVVLERAERANPALLVDVLRDGRVIVDRGARWRELELGKPSLQRAAQAQDARETAAALAALAELAELVAP